MGLVAYPSPASSKLKVVFAVRDNTTVSINLLNSAGASYYFSKHDASTGTFNSVIDVSDKAPGTYILKVTIGDKFYSRKVLIVK